MKRFTLALIPLATAALALAIVLRAESNDDQASPASPSSGPSEAALERTRRTVRMLDDIYKQTIVLITDKYVHTEDDFPAGSAAVALFKAITDKGWHTVRLIDATGEPYDWGNVARDAFEEAGIKALKRGDDYVEEVIEKDGAFHLRAITPVPVVMERCIMCHPHYADVEEGQPIGAISYSILID